MNLLPQLPQFSDQNVVLSETRNIALNSFRLVIILVAILTCASASNATTFVVTKVADTNDFVCNSDCSLREAVSNANSDPTNDIIVFDPNLYATSPVVLNLTDHITLGSSGTLIINGPGASLLTLDAGGLLYRIFTIQPGSNITLNNLTLTRGTGRGGAAIVAGGAIYNPVASLTINNSTISNSGAIGPSNEIRGGAIFNAGALTLNDSTISGNKSSIGSGADGGGVYNENGASINVIASSFLNNSAESRDGGGIFNSGNVNTTIRNSTFTGNTASNGSGISNSGGVMDIADTLFRNNGVPTGNIFPIGGGIHNQAGSLTVNRCTFENNISGNGGGLGNSGTASINESVFTGNSAANGSGGGIYNSGTITLADLRINNNLSASTSSFEGGSGGGIASTGSTSATRLIIQANSAARGGGLYLKIGNHSVEDSIISGHNVTGGGGGIYINGGTLSLSNSTVANNTAGNSGGGIAVESAPSLDLANVTVANNQAVYTGGVSSAPFTTTRARNSLIASNRNTTTSQNNAPDFYGTLTSQGYNLIGSTLNTTIVGVTTGNILNKDPQLVALRNNGGVTDTIALQATSPAIDAGDPTNFPLTDQRGVARAQDGDLDGSLLPDIGAYERQVMSFTITNSDDSSDGICDSDCSLRDAVATFSSAITPDNAIVFSPAVFSSPRTISLTLGELVVSSSPTFYIKGPGAHLLTIMGNDQSRVFSIRDTANAAISGVTIRDGNGAGAFNSGVGGGIYTDARFLSIVDSTVTGNAAASGGGIAALNSNTLLLVTNSTISENNASLSAGGILNNDNSTAKIFNSTISGNVINADTGLGGGIHNRSSLTVENSIVDGNIGGGIFNSGSLLLTGSILRTNRTVAVARDGGALHNSGTFSVTRSTITGNNSIGSGAGGGVYHIGGSGSITLSTISGNTAGSGGGIFSSSPLTIAASTIAFNNAEVRGGGVSVPSPNGGVPTARSSIFSDNTTLNSAPGPDYAGPLASQGHNLIRNISGTTITGNNFGNILGQAAGIDPTLRMNGGNTPTHALLFGSLARDTGTNNNLNFPTDQRGVGFVRLFDLTGITNVSDGTDIGAYEAQLSPIGPGIEGDVAPRTDGDGVLLSTDITQMRRFVTGLDAPTPGTSEGQRADCAPRASGGDGTINSTDVVQARRYVAGLDPSTPTGGPNRPSSIQEMLLESIDEDLSLFGVTREMKIRVETTSLSSTLRAPIDMILTGQEVAVSFTMEYDASVLSNPRIRLGDGVAKGVVLTVNSTKNGRLGILIDSSTALAISKGSTNLIVITFDSTSDADKLGTISFSDSVSARSVSDSNGNTLKAKWTVGKVS